VAEAYKAVGAVPFYQLGPSGADADYVWGSLVTTLTGPGSSTAGIAPGDVIQLRNVTLVHTTHNPDGSWYQMTQTAAHHTAIVTSVAGSTINLLQQNVQGPNVPPTLAQTVQSGSLDVADLQPGGTIWVYRPIA